MTDKCRCCKNLNIYGSCAKENVIPSNYHDTVKSCAYFEEYDNQSLINDYKKQLDDLKFITLGKRAVDLNTYQDKLIITDVYDKAQPVKELSIKTVKDYDNLIQSAHVVFNFTSVESVDRFIMALEIIKNNIIELN